MTRVTEPTLDTRGWYRTFLGSAQATWVGSGWADLSTREPLPKSVPVWDTEAEAIRGKASKKPRKTRRSGTTFIDKSVSKEDD